MSELEDLACHFGQGIICQVWATRRTSLGTHLSLVRIESYALVDDLLAAEAHDVKRCLEADHVPPLRQELAVDLGAAIAPSLPTERVEVLLVVEVFLIPELGGVVPACVSGICVKILLLKPMHAMPVV
jgi:hypothetical protein